MSFQDTPDALPATAADPGAETPVEAANPAIENMQNAWAGLTDGEITGDDLWLVWDAVGWPLVKVIALIVAVLLISGWARRFVTKVCTKANVEITLARFFGNLAKYAIMILGGITILQTFGVEATSFAAVIAAVGFAIGMALSGMLGNIAAGVMLLIFRPFRVGDVVSAAGVTGKVFEIGLFTTSFDTPDNRRIIVPNGSLFGDTIENVSHHDLRRVDVAVGVAYEADIDEARKVLEGVCANVEGGLDNPAPVVYLSELGGSSVDFALRVWAKASDFWAVKERLTRDTKVALDKAGIGIPYPQRDVHIPQGVEVTVKNG
ncbi:MAG: mechanosensitive ion channel family protein [Phycisphaerales bacterium JB059]